MSNVSMKGRFKLRKLLSLMTMSLAFVTLTACLGGGGGSSSSSSSSSSSGTPAPAPRAVNGGGTKGPLANANITVYQIDYTQANFQGAVVDTATTNAAAQITGLNLPFPLAPPYIMEVTSVPGTTIDLTTGLFPVITTLRTVITQELLDGGDQIYATPLTTMAVDLAITNADTNTAPWQGNNDAATTQAEFLPALTVAASQVASTLGFGIGSNVDVFDTPPLIDSTTDTTVEQTATAQYRAAIEAVTAIAFQISQQASGDADAVLSELANDLADGEIDGQVEGNASDVFTSTSLDVLEQDPALLPIPNAPIDPNTNQPFVVGAIEDVLVKETNDTGSTTDTSDLTSATGVINIADTLAPAETDPDLDGDGVLNSDDAFPLDATETIDTDGDGTGNNADTDDDNDGVLDGADAFPLNAAETTDTDSDGTGNNADDDDDGDGTPDATDDFPLDASKQNATDVDNDGWPSDQDADDNDAANPGSPFVDTDNDGVGNDTDDDDDNDGVLDGADDFPLDATETTDTDGDTIGNNSDTDDDGDTVLDVDDAFPLNSVESKDTDNDGLGNNADLDDDNDGLTDIDEDAAVADPDSDGIPNREDRDSDGDGYFDSVDLDPYDNTVQFNNAPVATGATVSLDEDVATAITLTALDDLNSAAVLTYLTTTPAHGVLSGAENSLTYTPTAEFSGTDSFSFTATDLNGAISNVAIVNITITAVNDEPVITQGASVDSFMDEDGSPTAFTAPIIDATDADNDALTWTLSSEATNGAATVMGTGSSPTITYIPTANFNGSDSFDVQVSDGNSGVATITVNMTVNAQDDAPTISGTPIILSTEQVAYSFTPTASDVEGDALTYSIVNTPSWASFDTATGELSGTPAELDVGGSFTGIVISVTANGQTTDLASFDITVQATPIGAAVWDNFDWDDGSTWQ